MGRSALPPGEHLAELQMSAAESPNPCEQVA